MMKYGKYNLIDTEEKLQWLDSILMNEDDTPKHTLMAYDTETNGLGLYKTTVVGFSISFNNYSGFYIPLLKWVRDESSVKSRSYDKVKYDRALEGHLECIWTGNKYPEFVTPEQYKVSENCPLITALLERWLTHPDVQLIMHNAPFDINHTYINLGVELKNNLFIDTSLLVHILNENESAGLKQSAERFKHKIAGYDPYKSATIEKQELDQSIIINGAKPGCVWRADLGVQSKYSCADTFLTFGLYEAAIEQFMEEYGDAGLEWFFEKEVMPVCKEVVVEMKRKGVYIDVDYFKKIQKEVIVKMHEIEDGLIKTFRDTDLLDGFTTSSSIEEKVSDKALILKIMELENLSVPTSTDKKTGEVKESINKKSVQEAYDKNPHWIYGYILGLDEIKYNAAKIKEIKQALFEEKTGKRHEFNINSDLNLRWLFCDKLKYKRSDLPQTDSATKENPIPSMAADVLEEHMLPKFPWVKKLLLWKRLEKLYTSYINPGIELNIKGYMYMDMKQNGTTSGRFSCSGGFNLQTLPRVEELDSCPKCESNKVKITKPIEALANQECNDCGYKAEDIICPSAIKRGFIAPPGYKIINADYSSLEPRCFAYMSGDKKIKEVYQAGLDLYSKVYCDMFDKAGKYSANPNDKNYLKKQNNAARTMIKPLVLGIPYGARDYQTAQLLGYTKEITNKTTGEKYTIFDAQRGKEIRDLYLNTYPQLKDYMLQQDIAAYTKGYVESLIGRRRHLRYAQVIYSVLSKSQIDPENLIECSSQKKYKGEFVDDVSKLGIKVVLTKTMLEEVAKLLKIDYAYILEKDGWSYIRNLLLSDLNNAKNNPIQALAGAITNRGMLDANRNFKEHNIEAYVNCQIHDEITCYAKEEHSELARDLLKVSMEDNEFTRLLTDIKMIAEPVICDNLKESK